MKYDFSTVIDRKGKDATAVDSTPYTAGAEVKEGFSRIPMWIADMNFATVPTIPQALIERANHPLYGYFVTSDEYYDSIINWQSVRNGVEDLKKEHIAYENGVLGAVAAAVQAFTTPGEIILMHAPTYVGFNSVLRNNGRRAVYSDLYQDEQGIWRMNYDDMDKKIKENKIHLAIFCSPHNPAGRVWEREELEKAMEVFRENDCLVVSDEIWSDILLSGHKHIPTQSISEDAKNRTIAVYAPSKTFNLAGLIGSYRIVYNKYLRDRMDKTEACSHYNHMNVMSMHALIGAYKPEGMEWVDELNSVLTDNMEFTLQYINDHFKGVTAARPQGTYMMFLECNEWMKAHDCSIEELIRKGIEHGIMWQDGRPFNGPTSMRINIALPHVLLEEALDRMAKYVFVD